MGKKFIHCKRGLGLIEVIIYVAIFGAITVFVINLLLTTMNTYIVARIRRNIDQQGAAAMERIIRELRLTESVSATTSLLTIHSGRLGLDTVISPTDSTKIIRQFYVSGEDLVLKEGGAGEVALTSGIGVSKFIVRFPYHLRTISGARSLFVRTSYAFCSDATVGTSPDTAFCTISKAASVALPGDIIFVGRGTYFETVTPANSGTAENRIWYVGDTRGLYTGDAGEVILDGYVDGGTGDRCYAFDLSAGRHYLGIDGFTATKYRQCDTDDGTFYFRGGSSNNIYRNIVAHDTRRDGIYVDGSNNLLENCLSYNVGDDGMTITNSYNTVRNCTVGGALGMDTGFSGYGGYTVEMPDGNFTNVFENNILKGAKLGNPGSGWQDQRAWYHNDWTGGAITGPGSGNISVDPLFFNEAAGDFHINQIAAGQGSNSPSFNTGSSTAMQQGLSIFTTRTDAISDAGIADMGYHYPLPLPDMRTIEVELTLQGGSGKYQTSQTFYGTAVLRGSY